MGGPWAKQKITTERFTMNVLRARLAHQRSHVITPPPEDRAVDVIGPSAVVHPR
jgi:hypothetical protein